MRIAYIVGEQLTSSIGVSEKVNSTIQTWENIKRANVELFTLCYDERNLKNRIVKMSRLVQSLIKLNKALDEYKPDIIYARYLIYVPFLIRVLRKNCHYIIELNTNDVLEYSKNKKITAIYNYATRGFLLSHASGFVFVTEELSRAKEFTKYNKNYIVIPNGINCNNIKHFREKGRLNNRIVFAGKPNQIWHGVDKILSLADKLDQYIFVLIGYESFGAARKNVIFMGYLSQGKTEEVIASCNVGISTLALHRNNLYHAAPLKTRQYLAQGLPVLLGYEDDDIEKQADFVLNIGNYENNVSDHIEEIEKFFQRCRNINSEDIIKYAKGKVDITNKAIRIYNFMIENR